MENKYNREAAEIIFGNEEDFNKFYEKGYLLLEDYLDLNEQLHDTILDASAMVPEYNYDD